MPPSGTGICLFFQVFSLLNRMAVILEPHLSDALGHRLIAEPKSLGGAED